MFVVDGAGADTFLSQDDNAECAAVHRSQRHGEPHPGAWRIGRHEELKSDAIQRGAGLQWALNLYLGGLLKTRSISDQVFAASAWLDQMGHSL